MLEFKKIDKRMRTGNYQKANFEYSGTLGNITIKNIGIRTKGNYSRKIPFDDHGNLIRTGFKIKFNSFNENQKFCSLNELDLHYSNILTEAFAYNLFNGAGVPVSKTGFCKLIIYLNNRKYSFGIYEIIEPVDKCFLKKRFGSADGNLYKCLKQKKGKATLTLESISDQAVIGVKDWQKNYRPIYDLKTNKNNSIYSEIKNFINKINTLDDEKFKNYILNVFDVDTFLKYLAICTLIGNVDDYRSNGNNYYLYFTGIKIIFIPFDFDNFCLDHIPSENADILKWIKRTGDNFYAPLSERILNNAGFYQKYKEYLIYYIQQHKYGFTIKNFYVFFKNFSNLQKYNKNNYSKINFHYYWDDYFRNVKYIKKGTVSLIEQLNLDRSKFDLSVNSYYYYLSYCIAELKLFLKNLIKRINCNFN